MGGAQHHARRLAGCERLLPARRAQAPAVAGFEPRKAELRHRRGQIVAAGFGEFQEGSGHDDTHRVAAEILAPGIAAAVAIKSGHRAERAELERFAEHIAGRSAAAVTAPVVPQHGCPLARSSPSRRYYALRRCRFGSGLAMRFAMTLPLPHLLHLRRRTNPAIGLSGRTPCATRSAALNTAW